MPNIVVVDQNGREHRVECQVGTKLMETLRDLEFGVAAICGGMCACATCHVYIDSAWLARLPAKQGDEQDMLDDLTHYREFASRLSCQLVFTAELDGLRLTIAPDE
jgi:ferredoxin, 2Fe-2S